VELPGIEPATEIALTCVNAVLDDAKVRETTRKYAKRPADTREVLTASTPEGPVASTVPMREVSSTNESRVEAEDLDGG
jgi:hypothetical protein